MNKLLLTSLLLSFFLSFSQVPQLTENTEISIITIGPGSLLNDSFGHNGFRVKNEYLDVVYDYGRYPFNDPDFYINFAKGKLKYLMGAANTRDVVGLYKQQNRTIKEQGLNLNQDQKEALLSYLSNNYKPENRPYLYDFFYDNCATKMRDVSETVLNGDIEYKTPKVYKEETFRDLIQNNLYWNSWGSFGIDIALGSVIDKVASPREYMFLPENIFQFFEEASFKSSNKQVVKESRILYAQNGDFEKDSFFTSPIFILSILSLFILFVTYKDNKNAKRSKWLDTVLFTITGAIGLLLVLLWFATDHSATAYNYNLLWACPISLIALFQVSKNTPKRWFISYLKFLVIMLCLMTLHWFIGVQVYAYGLIPLLIALAVRYVYLIRFFGSKDSKKQS
ncbi:DUF4105 domain-containing protein [Lacinutrix sp. Bg11-31]|uniref:lipoprotein N-acyltransferase Lnb domain-containing protein n=1 Tax=Lacinutrix sp. Bg11-31 TaxID=2057808 RepID=UPI000C30F085|nr:DUF4105 domain-containing protein [Lacinutrix sp. Bg11-31]AUC82054.1 hypothetical protein CW733_07920 [Lacinutrix sp. Bg11-31]